MGLNKLVGSLLFTAVFGIGIVLFALGFASDNNSAYSLGDSDDGFNNTQYGSQEDLGGYKTDVINSSKSFYESSIEGDGITFTTGNQFKVGPSTALNATTKLLNQGFTSIFGRENGFGFVLTSLLTFLSFIVITLIWKTWAGRNPE